MSDMEARLAEVLADHRGKTGIIFDQEDTFAHDDPSIRGPINHDEGIHGRRRAIQSATFRRCSGLSTSAASAKACAIRLLAVSASPSCSARRRSIAVRSMVGAVKSVTA